MNIKTLLAGLAGGVASFFLGWLIYGIALDSYMKENTSQCLSLNMDQFNYIILFFGSLVWGVLFAIILSWANANSLVSGLLKGAVLGFLFSLSIDLNYYSMTSMFNNINALAVDIIANTVSSAVLGAVIGLILGTGKGATTSS